MGQPLRPLRLTGCAPDSVAWAVPWACARRAWGVCRLVCALHVVPNNAACGLANHGQASRLLCLGVRESWSGPVFGIRVDLRLVLLVALQAASSQSQSWRSGTGAFSGSRAGSCVQWQSFATGTPAKPIDNRVMAKKTKAKAPAKKATAAKAKATKSSGGAVVEVEACKRSASSVHL